ncbi:MAG TPA: hypothetical protein PKY81_09600 [bacterium]|nr:hypothetical protein [bacterium]HPN31200.1 hypothetical protein [bacterium]
MKKFNKIILSSLVLLLIFSIASFAAPRGKSKDKDFKKGPRGMEMGEKMKEKRLDPKVIEIQNKIQDLRKEGRDLKIKYDAASEQDKSAIKIQMKEKIAATYDLRIQLMEYNISKMQTRLQEFKSNKDKNVDELLEKVISFEPPKEKNKKFLRNKNKKDGFRERKDNRSRRGGRWMDDDDEFCEE